MTPEDKIAYEIRGCARMLVVIWITMLVGCYLCRGDVLLPPLGYEIGEPPAPPPNPNVQYWYTMDVPGPQGVLLQEVFAPRLVAQVASDPQGVEVETPEPGTLLIVLAYLGVGRACQWCYRRKATKQIGNGDGFKVCCNRCLSRARKALEEK